MDGVTVQALTSKLLLRRHPIFICEQHQDGEVDRMSRKLHIRQEKGQQGCIRRILLVFLSISLEPSSLNTIGGENNCVYLFIISGIYTTVYNIFPYLQNNVRTKKKVTRMAIKTAMQFTIGILMMVTLAATWRTKLLLSQDSTKLLNIQHHCTLFPVLVLFTNFGFLLIIYLNAVYCNS